jgi:hypothetical protein
LSKKIVINTASFDELEHCQLSSTSDQMSANSVA